MYSGLSCSISVGVAESRGGFGSADQQMRSTRSNTALHQDGLINHALIAPAAWPEFTAHAALSAICQFHNPLERTAAAVTLQHQDAKLRFEIRAENRG
jgi:hypothetical protein